MAWKFSYSSKIPLKNWQIHHFQPSTKGNLEMGSWKDISRSKNKGKDIAEMYKMEFIRAMGSWRIVRGRFKGSSETGSMLGWKREVRRERRWERSTVRICRWLKWGICKKAKRYTEVEKIAKISRKMLELWPKETLSTVLFQTNIDITLNLTTKKYQTLIFFKGIIKIKKISRSTPGANLIILTPSSRNLRLLPITLTKC